MGVYVREMKMPTSCISCPFMINRGKDECILQSEEDNESFTTFVQMKAGCPLNEMSEYGKWINVNDSLPELGKVVLVHGAGGGIYTAKLTVSGWWKLNSRFHTCDPTHWMPLPDAPKEEKA